MKRRAADDLPTMNDVPPFDKEEVRHAVGNMKNGKAPGPDRIEVEVLKASYEVIHKELRDFNACLRCGSFPRIWKQGSIRTLLKDADRDATNLTSYRPICLLSVMEKCLEKLLAERLRPVFMDSRYAAANQFGFQKENRRRTRSWL
ncbi:reverse transcriptase [Apis mellifera caucasica]|nr:reverse transcriptase [Apis mellifera caucasica]